MKIIPKAFDSVIERMNRKVKLGIEENRYWRNCERRK